MSLVALPGGPPPEGPIPETPVDGVDLSGFASIGAQLASPTVNRAQVLARAGLTEARWVAIEATWGLRLASAATRGDLALFRRYERASDEARDVVCRVIPLAEYVAIAGKIAAGADPAGVLAAAATNAAELGRTLRYWSSKAREDAEVARALGLPPPASTAR